MAWEQHSIKAWSRQRPKHEEFSTIAPKSSAFISTASWSCVAVSAVVTQAAQERGVSPRPALEHSSARQTETAQLEASLRLHVVLNNIGHLKTLRSASVRARTSHTTVLRRYYWEEEVGEDRRDSRGTLPLCKSTFVDLEQMFHMYNLHTVLWKSIPPPPSFPSYIFGMFVTLKCFRSSNKLKHWTEVSQVNTKCSF